MAIDLTNLLSIAKTRFTIRSQSSRGHLLGYALLLPDVQPVDELVKFVPWEEEVQLSQSVASRPIVTSRSPDQGLELYLSESSSGNETLESEPPRVPGGSQDEFNFSVNLSQSPVTLSQNFPKPPILSGNSSQNHNSDQTSRYSSTSSPEYQDSSQATSCYSSPITYQPLTQTTANSLCLVSSTAIKPPSAPSPNSEPIKLQRVPVAMKVCPQSLACQESPINLVDKVASSDIQSVRKRKSEELDSNSNKRLVNPDNSTAKYDMFIEVIEKEADKKESKVKCMLCSDGKIYLYGSMQRHIKGIHMPPVKCEVCDNEFSAAGVDHHMRKCARKKQLVEKNENKKRSDNSSSNISTTKVQYDPLDASNCKPLSVGVPERNTDSSGRSKPIVNHLLTQKYVETPKRSGICTKKKLDMFINFIDTENRLSSSGKKSKDIRILASRNLLTPPLILPISSKLSGGSSFFSKNKKINNSILSVNSSESKSDRLSKKYESSSKIDDSSSKIDNSSSKIDDSLSKKDDSPNKDDSSSKKDDSSSKKNDSLSKNDDSLSMKYDSISMKDESISKKDDSISKNEDSLNMQGDRLSKKGNISNKKEFNEDDREGLQSYFKSADTISTVPFPSVPKDYITLILRTAAVNGVSNSIKMGIKKEAKFKKAMKKFGNKYKVSHKTFKFFLGSQQLIGDESVVDMDGHEISVVGNLPT